MEQIPGHLGRLPSAESALEAKLMRKSLWESIDCPKRQIGLLFQAIRSLHLTGTDHLVDTLVICLPVIQLELPNQIERIQIRVSWSPSPTRTIVVVKVVLCNE